MNYKLWPSVHGLRTGFHVRSPSIQLKQSLYRLVAGRKMPTKERHRNLRNATVNERELSEPELQHSERTVALLSPYDGGNLGDAAIQQAIIENLTGLQPVIRIVGITLDPAKTAARHQIRCYPLAANATAHYGVSGQRAGVVPGEEGAGAGLARRKVHEFLHRASRAVGFFRLAKALVKEATHTVRSYRLLRDVDMLVVAGGGQLDEEWGGAWGHPFALMKWSVLTRAAGGVVVFLSVGACQLSSPVTRFFLRIALSLASYRSYRDAESRRLALEIARHAEGAVVPDLAFSLRNFVDREYPASGEKKLSVGVSPIAWRHSCLWPTENPVQHRRYLIEFALFVRFLLERGIEVRLFSSSPPDDQIFEDVYQLLEGNLSPTARHLLSCATVTTLAELLELLQSVEIVVTSRLHGALLSFILRRPVLAISYDRKVATLMEQLEQSSSCVDIESVDSAVLVQKFALLETTRDQVKSTIDERCNQYGALLKHQYKEISTMLECHSRPARQQGRALP